jgi:hypothetical protein
MHKLCVPAVCEQIRGGGRSRQRYVLAVMGEARLLMF